MRDGSRNPHNSRGCFTLRGLPRHAAANSRLASIGSPKIESDVREDAEPAGTLVLVGMYASEKFAN